MAYYQFIEPGHLQFSVSIVKFRNHQRGCSKTTSYLSTFEPEAHFSLLFGAALGGSNYLRSQRLDPDVYPINQMSRYLRRF